MTTESFISRIQVRRGLLQDLPLLEIGELAYATDQRRLFIGNPRQQFTANGSTANFTINQSLVRTSTIFFTLIDDVLQVPQYSFLPDRTVISFTTPPPQGSIVDIGYNSEIRLYDGFQGTDLLTLGANQTNWVPTVVAIETSYANTGIIDYSVSSSQGLAVGTLTFITDGVNIEWSDSSHNTSQSDPVKLRLQLTNNGQFIELQYINADAQQARVYYSSRVWKTV